MGNPEPKDLGKWRNGWCSVAILGVSRYASAQIKAVDTHSLFQSTLLLRRGCGWVLSVAYDFRPPESQSFSRQQVIDCLGCISGGINHFFAFGSIAKGPCLSGKFHEYDPCRCCRYKSPRSGRLACCFSARISHIVSFYGPTVL